MPDSENCKEIKKIHSWRLCPVGEHWVRTHNMRVPPSKEHPEGYDTIRHAHCARNPSGKDQLYLDEILEISDKKFFNAQPKPCPLKLKFGEDGSKYDDLIAGWTKYWNDVLSPTELLDPNLVKALIAFESSFNPNILANIKNLNSARGLMQLINSTRKILGNEKGELINHFVTVSREDLNNPSVNICAGIRWLFNKRKLTSSRLGRVATWEEAVFEYKGGRTVTKKRMQELMDTFSGFLEAYKKCVKN